MSRITTTLCSLFVLALFANAAFGQSAPEILYYPFDEGSGTTATNYADPGQGNVTSTFIGTPTWVSPGEVGNSAIEFNGSSQLPTGLDGSQFNNTDFTIEFWMLYGSTPSGANYPFSSGVNSFRAFVDGVANEFLLVRYASGTDIVRSTTAIGFSSNWHHIAIVHENATTTTTLYVDGVQEDQNTTLAITSSGELHIGGHGTSGNQGGHTIDEFRVYDYARTQQQIQDEMNLSILLGGGGGPGPVNEPELAVFRSGNQVSHNGSVSLDLLPNQVRLVSFDLQNVGDETLELLTPNFVDIEGVDDVQLQSLDATLAASGTGQMTLEVTVPMDLGPYSFTVELPHNTPQPNPFVFTVTGEVTETINLSSGSRGCQIAAGTNSWALLTLLMLLALLALARRHQPAST